VIFFISSVGQELIPTFRGYNSRSRCWVLSDFIHPKKVGLSTITCMFSIFSYSISYYVRNPKTYKLSLTVSTWTAFSKVTITYLIPVQFPWFKRLNIGDILTHLQKNNFMIFLSVQQHGNFFKFMLISSLNQWHTAAIFLIKDAIFLHRNCSYDSQSYI